MGKQSIIDGIVNMNNVNLIGHINLGMKKEDTNTFNGGTVLTTVVCESCPCNINPSNGGTYFRVTNISCLDDIIVNNILGEIGQVVFIHNVIDQDSSCIDGGADCVE